MDTFGASHFILNREVVLSSEVKNAIEKGPQSIVYTSFIERFFLLCPLFGVSITRGSTVFPHTGIK